MTKMIGSRIASTFSSDCGLRVDRGGHRACKYLEAQKSNHSSAHKTASRTAGFVCLLIIALIIAASAAHVTFFTTFIIPSAPLRQATTSTTTTGSKTNLWGDFSLRPLNIISKPSCVCDQQRSRPTAIHASASASTNTCTIHQAKAFQTDPTIIVQRQQQKKVLPWSSSTSATYLCPLLAVLEWLLVNISPQFLLTSPIVYAEAKRVTVCYLRMPFDDPNLVAGLQIAFARSNFRHIVPSTNFTLNVTTIPCEDPEDCVVKLENQTFWDMYVGKFLNESLPTAVAIYRPNHLLAPAIINATRDMKRAGIDRIPFILDPNSYDPLDFEVSELLNQPMEDGSGREYNPSNHIVHFDAMLKHQLTHLFAFMHQDDGIELSRVNISLERGSSEDDEANVEIGLATGGCAYAGVVYHHDGDKFTDPKFAKALDDVRALFVRGGMSDPATLAYTSLLANGGGLVGTSDAELEDFFMVGRGKTVENRARNRRCFVAILEPRALVEMVSRLMNITNGSFAAEGKVFYATSMVGQDTFELMDNTVLGNYSSISPFNINYLQWFPTFNETLAKTNPTTNSGALLDGFKIWALGRSDDGVVGVSRRRFVGNLISLIPANAPDLPANLEDLYTDVEGTLYPLLKRYATKLVTPLLRPSTAMLRSFLVARYYLDAYAAALSLIPLTVWEPDVNTGIADAPIPVTDLVVARIYEDTNRVDNFQFYALSSRCPRFPFPQVCDCNVAARTFYVIAVIGGNMFINSTAIDFTNTSTSGSGNSSNSSTALVPMGSRSVVIFDNALKGQKGITTTAFPNECSSEADASSTSYPLTGLMILRRNGFGVTPLRYRRTIMNTLGALTRQTNYAKNSPARPYRLAVLGMDDTSTAQETIDQYADSYNPFVIYGSFSISEIKYSNTLTLYSSSSFKLEDPALAPRASTGNTSGWSANVIAIDPVLADYIHALVNYYYVNTLFASTTSAAAARRRRYYSGIHVITSTREEAVLVSKSLATFNILFPAEYIKVENSSAVWRSTIEEWLAGPAADIPTTGPSASFPLGGGRFSTGLQNSPSYPAPSSNDFNPFVLAVTLENPNNVVFAAHDAFIAADANTQNRGKNATLGVACSDSARATTEATKQLNISKVAKDLVFVAISSEWWDYSDAKLIDTYNYIPENARAWMGDDGFFTALGAFEFAKELAAYANNDLATKAAEILYRVGSVTTRVNTYGPFYSGTCTKAQIDRNARDRTCQCNKGPRKFHVHSTKDQQSYTYSTRTNRFAWSMTTCGVAYTDYVPPPEAFAASTLSSSAIAGIAVGSASFFLLTIGGCGVFFFTLLAGKTRNNKNAPKDPSQPFAIVFTDIQSSTALWARAPTAMSDAIDQHHAIIRKLIAKHSGYEVKTVGDSFMVAFKDAVEATRFSLDVQIAMFEADWSSEIDASYIELIAEAEVAEAHDAADGDDEDGGHGHTRFDDDYSLNDDQKTATADADESTDRARRVAKAQHQQFLQISSGGGDNITGSRHRSPSQHYSGAGQQHHHVGGNNVTPFDAFSSATDVHVATAAQQSAAKHPSATSNFLTALNNRRRRTLTISDAAGPMRSASSPSNATQHNQQQGQQLQVYANGCAYGSGNIDDVSSYSMSADEREMLKMNNNNNNSNTNNQTSRRPKSPTTVSSGAASPTSASAIGIGLAKHSSAFAHRVPSTNNMNLINPKADASPQFGDDAGGPLRQMNSANPHSFNASPPNTTLHEDGGAKDRGNKTVSPRAANMNQTYFSTAQQHSSNDALNNNNNCGQMLPNPSIVPANVADTSAISDGGLFGEGSSTHKIVQIRATSINVSNANYTLIGTSAGASPYNGTIIEDRALSAILRQSNAFMTGGEVGGGATRGAADNVADRTTSDRPTVASATGTGVGAATRLSGTAGAESRSLWHGLRLRIGVHFGMGDIRKDPVSLGYDYYGTVVNTAARVEGVGHGGQTLLTSDTYEQLPEGFSTKQKAVVIALGPQPLRGLDEPIKLYQIVPAVLDGRSFPPLRLHIEKDSDETDFTSDTGSASNVDTPEDLAEKLCQAKQFANVRSSELVLQYYFLNALLAPTRDKYKTSVLAKLGEAWGFEKVSAAVANSNRRMRLQINLLGKVVKSFHASRKAAARRKINDNATSTICGTITNTVHTVGGRGSKHGVGGRGGSFDAVGETASSRHVNSRIGGVAAHIGERGATANNNHHTTDASNVQLRSGNNSNIGLNLHPNQQQQYNLSPNFVSGDISQFTSQLMPQGGSTMSPGGKPPTAPLLAVDESKTPLPLPQLMSAVTAHTDDDTTTIVSAGHFMQRHHNQQLQYVGSSSPAGTESTYYGGEGNNNNNNNNGDSGSNGLVTARPSAKPGSIHPNAIVS